MKTLLLSIMTGLCLCAALPAAGQKARPQNAAAFNAFWAKFQRAVAGDDRETVAALTKFPLTMPYGVRPIRTKAQLLKDYAKIFDAETKRCLAAARPERENDKSTRFNVFCGEAMLYQFDLVGGAYKFVAVDNINE